MSAQEIVAKHLGPCGSGPHDGQQWCSEHDAPWQDIVCNHCLACMDAVEEALGVRDMPTP